MHYEYGKGSTSDKAEIGDTVSLQGVKNKDLEVVECQETEVPMLNIDADELAPGDLVFIKRLGLTISNPDTEKPVALGVDFKEGTFGQKIKDFFDSEDEETDDSDFFYTPTRSSAPLFGGGSFGGFGGGFGGFGGGGFGGGGASRGF